MVDEVEEILICIHHKTSRLTKLVINQFKDMIKYINQFDGRKSSKEDGNKGE